jgi:hypothetical protein
MRLALSLPDGKMDITFLGGGEQATLLVRTPAGQTVLVNGATQSGNLSSELGMRLPPLDRTLGAWLLTDSTSAPLQEFDLLTQRFTPGLAYRAVRVPSSADWRRVSSHLALQGVIASRLLADQRFDLGHSASLQVLAASDQGTSLLLQWRNLCLLVPGGLDGTQLKRLAGRQDWQGCLVVLSQADMALQNTTVDWNNAHPLAVLVAGSSAPAPAAWLDTTRKGWIEIKSDGWYLWMASQR